MYRSFTHPDQRREKKSKREEDHVSWKPFQQFSNGSEGVRSNMDRLLNRPTKARWVRRGGKLERRLIIRGAGGAGSPPGTRDVVNRVQHEIQMDSHRERRYRGARSEVRGRVGNSMQVCEREILEETEIIRRESIIVLTQATRLASCLG